MKSSITSEFPPAPGQELLDALVARWIPHWDWYAVSGWVERCVERMGEAEINLCGCYELLEDEWLRAGGPSDGDAPEPREWR